MMPLFSNCHRSSVLVLTSGLVFAMLLVACGEPQGEETVEESYHSGDRESGDPGRLLGQRGDLDAREVEWSEGDASSTVRGYFRGDLLVYIDEEMDRGEYGATREEYLLHDGQLIHFRRVGTVLAHDAENRPTQQEVETEVLFNLDGRARVVRNLEGGVDRDLDESEVQAIRSHFVVLRDRLIEADP